MLQVLCITHMLPASPVVDGCAAYLQRACHAYTVYDVYAAHDVHTVCKAAALEQRQWKAVQPILRSFTKRQNNTLVSAIAAPHVPASCVTHDAAPHKAVHTKASYCVNSAEY